MGRRTQVCKFSLEEVLPKIGGDFTFSALDQTFTISLTSERLMLFQQSQVCACCQLPATHFWAEALPKPHLNLYGMENGKEILFTKDHIIPQVLGGTTNADNLQVLCTVCNGLKGASIISLSDLYVFRQILNGAIPFEIVIYSLAQIAKRYISGNLTTLWARVKSDGRFWKAGSFGRVISIKNSKTSARCELVCPCMTRGFDKKQCIPVKNLEYISVKEGLELLVKHESCPFNLPVEMQ